MKYGVGQKLTLKEDLEIEGYFGLNKTYKSGTEVFVTANIKNPQIIYKNEDIQLLPKDTEIEGFSAIGITDWIYEYVSKKLPIDDVLEDNDIDIKDFKDSIIDSLVELGFYNSEGNID